MKTTPQTMRDEFNKLFPIESAQLRLRQLWWIVKFAKYVRLRARNNAAFNNLANVVFDGAKFATVNKTRPDGTSYPGLQISINGEVGLDTNEEGEE